MKIAAKTRKPNKPNTEVFKDSYDEKSPITGEYCVLVEEVTNPAGEQDLYKVCMQTGYQTYFNSWRTDKEAILAVVEQQMPDYVVNSKFTDPHGIVWYPMMTMSIYGMLHPIKDEHNQMQWAVSSLEMLTSPDEIHSEGVVRLPIQTSEGVRIALFKVRPQPDKVWQFNDFESALGYYQDMVNEQIQSGQDEEE